VNRINVLSDSVIFLDVFQLDTLSLELLILLCNKSSIADREGQWILHFQMITVWGVWCHCIFHSGYCDYGRVFRYKHLEECLFIVSGREQTASWISVSALHLAKIVCLL